MARNTIPPKTRREAAIDWALFLLMAAAGWTVVIRWMSEEGL